MSKDKILAAIQRNKPAGAPLPDIPAFAGGEASALDTFILTAEAGGSRVVRGDSIQDLNALIKERFPEAESIASPLAEVACTVALDEVRSPAELEPVDVAVINGQLGVAENGAVWVTEEDCGQRVLPFIAQHLVILLNQDDIVHNMHEAYDRIKIDAAGFGVFIAGPSKTADIEQSLVIGAQGARSLTVVLTAVH